MRLVSDGFQQRCGQPRFADPALAGNKNNLTFAGLCIRPAAQQQFEFFIPPDERGQAACMQRLEAAFDRR